MASSINIKRVAEVAGVSTTTVSFVLNNRGSISEETRLRVLDAVKTLGYTRSAAAVHLRNQEARVIGYAWDKKRSRFNPVLDNFLYDILQRSEASGRNLLVFPYDVDSHGVEAYRQLYESRKVDGFILSSTRLNDPRFAYLLSANIPFAAFGRSASEFDDAAHWVDIDGAVGICEATLHLIQQGYRRVAFIGWPPGSLSGDVRYQGYVRALKDCDLPLLENYVRRTQNESDRGHDAAMSLFNEDIPPEAIVTVSDVLATGVLHAAHQLQRRVAVTGFDDTPIAEFSYPALTSIRQPLEQVAEILMSMLFAQLEERPVEVRQHLLKPELIIRASSQMQFYE